MNSYFSHDSNARNSDKLLPVRMKYGAEGYGIYFMLLERLRDESEYVSVKDYNMIAFDLRVDAGKIKSIIEDFGLFVFTENGEYFYSEGFMKRMEIKDAKSKKRSEAGKKGAKKRWGSQDDESDKENNSNAIAMPSKNIASKVKERKESKVIIKEIPRKYSDEHLRLAQLLQDNLINDFPKEMDKVKIDKWADDIRLIEERDSITPEQIEYVIRWLPSNTFWSTNVRSPKKLREQFERLVAEIKKEREKPKNSYSKQVTRKETLPDWASEENQIYEETPLSPEEEAEIKAKIERLSQPKQQAGG